MLRSGDFCVHDNNDDDNRTDHFTPCACAWGNNAGISTKHMHIKFYHKKYMSYGVVTVSQWWVSWIVRPITSLLEKKPSLSLLSIESQSRSEEGRGDQQMSSELLNKAFSTKSTQCIRWKYKYRKPNDTWISMKKRGTVDRDIFAGKIFCL